MKQINHPEFFRKKQVFLITSSLRWSCYTFTTQLLFLQSTKAKQVLHFSSTRSQRGYEKYFERYKRELGFEDFVGVNYELVDYPYFTIAQIYKIVKKVHKKRKLDILYFDDYSNISDPENRDYRAKFLKDLAIEFGVAVVVNYSLKSPKRKQKRLTKLTLKKSLPAAQGTIVDYADVILSLYKSAESDWKKEQKSYAFAAKTDQFELLILKDRNEFLYGFYLDFLKEKRVFQFDY